MIPNRAASSCSSSVSTLAKTRSGWATDAASKMGANIRHGPHQLAQKSTSTVSFDLTVSSKLPLFSATVTASSCPGAAVRAPHGDVNQYTPMGIPTLVGPGAGNLDPSSGPTEAHPRPHPLREPPRQSVAHLPLGGHQRVSEGLLSERGYAVGAPFRPRGPLQGEGAREDGAPHHLGEAGP